MARQVDREVILGFVAEARDYLPLILQGIESYSPALPAERLEEAHRLVHTIKGSASMVGLSSLSHVAFKLEAALEELASVALTAAHNAGSILRQLLGLVEAFVDAIDQGEDLGLVVLAEAERLDNKLRGLPEQDAPVVVAAPIPAPPVVKSWPKIELP